MKLKFKQQQYQEDATNAVIKCFEGQPKGNRKDLIDRRIVTKDQGTFFEQTYEEEVVAFGNKRIELNDIELRKNINSVQRANGIIKGDYNGLDNFTIEMETGTGKTYTYIKTMYELNAHYGWSKFIVMTPSIAIREGVQKSFQITAEHFQELYHKKIRFFVYNSGNSSNIANINSFASDSEIWCMIINYQAFNTKVNNSKAGRRIFEELDELNSRRPIDVIKSVSPILIIDEPQKFGPKAEDTLKEFNPLFILRYSATHKVDYNKIYRLDAIDAYNQKLVKKISVKGIEVLNNKSESTYLYLDRIDIGVNKNPVAIVEIETKTSTGTKRETKKLKAGDDLYTISKELQEYKGFVVSEIDARYNQNKVSFTNGFEITVGQVVGDTEESYLSRIQIRETIRSHFEKEKALNKLGIKVLSLFFIDEVAKYKYYDDNKQAFNGEYARIFEEEYRKELSENYNFLDSDYKKYLDSIEGKKVHAGYFSIDKKASKGRSEDDLVYIDSKIDDKDDKISNDEDAYDLIMKDKERLLSLEEPVRFIFSHSALREGWDNPNIFQICTLKKSNSEISKRQEIGRGLRICVNNNGDRMDYSALEDSFHRINTLTVVASESYESFAKGLQDEISKTITARPSNFTQDIFIGKTLTNAKGEKYEFTQEHYQDFLIHNVMNGYVDKKNNYKVTEKLLDDIDNGKVEVPEELQEFKTEITSMLKSMFAQTSIYDLTTNEKASPIKTLMPNKNFDKAEFQALWNKINIKTIYEVDFDTKELIEKAVDSINKKLQITKMKVKITQGEQAGEMSQNTLKESSAMYSTHSSTEVVEEFSPSEVAYDLIGSISKDTGLTRKTIVEIIKNIDEKVFFQYRYNPEEFIRKATNLINNEKATTIIEGITYKKLDQRYDNEIFTINNVNGKLDENAIEVKKHIYDFLVTDSKNEREFAKELEKGEVTVYAKLPNGFKIPTPVGNYNPDWAIVFDNKDFKYVYFVAETKGSMNSLELRDVEKAKIECARKHFESISNGEVKYDVVDSYQSLIDILTAK